MIKVLNGMKNGDLEQALGKELCEISPKSGKKYRDAVMNN